MVAELRRRREIERKPPSGGWQSAHEDYCRKMGVREGDIAYPEEIGTSPWLQTLPLRAQRLLAITHFERHSSTIAAVDVSQNIGRQRVVMRPA